MPKTASNLKAKARFNHDWLLDSRFKGWLAKHPTDNTKALCKLCNNKSITVRASGVTALTSHMKCHKASHVQNVMKSPILNFVQVLTSSSSRASDDKEIEDAAEIPDVSAVEETPPAVSSETSPETPTETHPETPAETPREVESSSSKSVVQYFKNSNLSVRDAEIRWAMKCVISHFSYNSCRKLTLLFKTMFTDSQIAKDFKLGSSKCSYLINYGIYPVLVLKLKTQINSSPFHTVMFDESLNKINQDCQMDVQVRYWDAQRGIAVSRYIVSKFLKNPNAKNLTDMLLGAVEDLDSARQVALSMDGPNVNWSVVNLLNDDRTKNNMNELLQLGSCSLHIINGAFKKGFDNGTKWEMKKILNAMYKFFYDAPARRGAYIRESRSQTFPKRFFSVRWVENDEVAERAIEVWPNVCKTIKWFKLQPSSKQPKKNFQYEVLGKYFENVEVIARFHFFRDISEILNSYLVTMQTDKPMVPFLCDRLIEVLKKLMKIVFTRNTVEELSTPTKFKKLKIEDKMLHLPDKDVKLPTGTSLAVRKLNDAQKYHFKKDAKNAVLTLLGKLVEKNPMAYSINRAASCIAPKHMINPDDRRRNISYFNGIVDLLYQRNLVLRKECDKAKSQYEDFLDLIKTDREKFLSFDLEKDRLDTFLGGYLYKNPKFNELWHVCIFIFILPHGQAVVERGFNINSDCLVENLANESLIAQRMIYDELKSYDTNPRSYKITTELRKSCLTAYNRYNAERKLKKAAEEKTEKQIKAEVISGEISSINRTIDAVKVTIRGLKEECKRCYDEAEKKSDVAMLVAGNGMRKKIKEKKELILTLEGSVTKLEEEKKAL